MIQEFFGLLLVLRWLSTGLQFFSLCNVLSFSVFFIPSGVRLKKRQEILGRI